MRRTILTVLALAMSLSWATAQNTCEERFNPHWLIRVDGGAAHTVGEASFGRLISPAASVSAGYRFTPVWSLTAGLGGWRSKGSWVTPDEIYEYGFLQANVDVRMDLVSLFGRYRECRVANPYLMAGVGVNGAFDNDEAVALANRGIDLSYLWTGRKAFVAGRFGAGIDFRLSRVVGFNVEVNANVLSDRYNSKKAGNADWQFNALAGLVFRIGSSSGRRSVAPVPAPVPPAPRKTEEPATAETPVEQPVNAAPVEPAKQAEAKPAPQMRRDIFFLIDSSTIRTSEREKISALAAFMAGNPGVSITVTGYADIRTGNAAVNRSISRRRAEAVAAALEAQGVARERIRVEYKGDTVQPFAVNAENRVTICIAK